jgi:hypothetical protein
MSKSKNSSLKKYAAVVKELGWQATLISIIALMFHFYSTPEQKQLLIDNYFLFRNFGSTSTPVYMTVSFLTIMLMTSVISCYVHRQRSKAENNRIGKEKSHLQEELLKKKLKTSE